MKNSTDDLSRECRKSLKKWPSEVWQRFEVCAPQHSQVDRLGVAKGHQLEQALLNLIRDASMTPELRVSYVYLILHGRYIDSKILATSITALLGRNPESALQLAWSSNDRRLGRRRLAYRTTKPVIDVTRFVDEFQLSGIPRVVRNLIGSAAFADAHLVVWDDGAPCPVWLRESVDKETEVWFSSTDWRRPHQRTRWLGLLWSRLMHMPVVAGLVSLAALLFRGVLQKFAGSSREPKKVLILDDACLLLLEITRTSEIEALKLARNSFEQMTLSAWVHDTLPITHPEFFPDLAVKEHLYYLQICLRADLLFAATPIIEHELQAFAGLHNRVCPPVRQLQLPVTTAPYSEIAKTAPPQDLSGPYFVFMGGFGARKGLGSLKEYLASHLPQGLPFQVLVIGSPLRVREQMLLSRTLLLPAGVFRLLQPQPDAELMKIIGHSRGVIYPSMAEGFGLPVLEAISLGVPVITRPTEVNLWLASQYEGVFPVFSEQNDAAIVQMRQWAATRFEFASPLPAQFPDSVSEWAESIRSALDSTHSQIERHPHSHD